jgi:hypothetical protein
MSINRRCCILPVVFAVIDLPILAATAGDGEPAAAKEPDIAAALNMLIGWISKGWVGGPLLGAVLILLLSWLGKDWLGKIIETEYSAARRNRREFAQKMIQQVSDLAKEHYWFLANHAGVLAGLLEEHLSAVDYYLLLEWQQAEDLEKHLEANAKIQASQSFSAFCRLIWLFDKFQFQGSNTYLLNSDAAGRICRRLYNSFVAELPIGEQDAQTRLDMLRILAVMRRNVTLPDFPEPQPAADLSAHDFNEKFCGVDRALHSEFEAYQHWLATRLDRVALAARALRAYNELLSHELAILYGEWFLHSAASGEPYAKAARKRRWPEILTTDSARAIQCAWFRSELLQPLGRGTHLDRPVILAENKSAKGGSAGAGEQPSATKPPDEHVGAPTAPTAVDPRER